MLVALWLPFTGFSLVNTAPSLRLPRSAERERRLGGVAERAAPRCLYNPISSTHTNHY